MKAQLMRDPLSFQVVWDAFTFAGVSPGHGTVFVRVRGDGYILKAPWCAPLFSERNGYKLAVINFLGWRVFPLRAEELVDQLVKGDECSTRRP